MNNTFSELLPRYFKNEWSKATSDTDILSSVTGAKIEFECSMHCLPALLCYQSNMSERESDVRKSEVQKLLSKQVIFHCDYVPSKRKTGLTA